MSPRRLVSFVAVALVVFWIASFLPGGGEAAWFAWGIVVLVAVIGGRSAANAVECVALAVGSGIGLAWGGLTQTAMPGGPSGDEVVSTSIIIGVAVLVIAGVVFAFGSAGRALRQGVSGAQRRIDDARPR